MDTVFDSQQWAWRRARKKKYALLSNAVEVEDRGTVHVAVPTEFFKYLSDVAGISREALTSVSIYCDKQDKGWIFGYTPDGATSVDLWEYKKLPDWLNPAR